MEEEEKENLYGNEYNYDYKSFYKGLLEYDKKRCC